MFLSILKWSIISLTIIYLIHHLYMFFLNTLTVPKVKDLVNKPTEQYDEIFKTLQNSSSSDMINSNGNGNGNRNRKQNKHKNNETLSDDKMTEELSSFLNELKKNPTNNNNVSNNNNMNFSNSQGNEPSHILSANDIGLYSPY